MLNSNPSNPQKAIAGTFSGRRILCSPQAAPVYENLVKLAKSGNHWARIAVRGITGLISGRLNNENIYIEKKQSLAYGKGAFHLVLPGVMASLEELPNGSYIVQRIKIDGNYQRLQEESKKPGLWRVYQTNRTPEIQKDGRILNKEYRPVVITDMVKSNVRDIADITRENINKKEGMIKNIAEIQGFDMHYTPGEGGIVGLKPAKSALATVKDAAITRSAMLLANTMYQARNIEGVLWYSDWGGSGVLTRAMEILDREKNISLETHMIFLNRPTSKASYAIELAGKLGIKPQAKGKNTGLNYKELKGNIFVSDVGADKGTLAGTLAVAGFGVGAVGATTALATVSLTGAGVVGATGAMFFVGATIKSAMKNLKGKNYK